MSNLILVIGESGTGKSTSIETLDPKETFLIQAVNKPLPFRGFKKKYPLLTKKLPGNRVIANNIELISRAFQRCELDTKIKTIIVDDFQYVLSDEYMRKATEKGFDKFTIMAQNYYSILKIAQNMREDLNIIFLSHSETKDDGTTKVKTIGKLLDDKITIEGLFTIVLNTKVEDGSYYFETQNNGFNTSKSPKGMFEEFKIPNDLKYVVDKVNEYYGG